MQIISYFFDCLAKGFDFWLLINLALKKKIFYEVRAKMYPLKGRRRRYIHFKVCSERTNKMVVNITEDGRY